MHAENNAVVDAISAVGGQAKLAGLMGVSHQAVMKWRRGRVPAERVLELARISGIPRQKIRPDLYPDTTQDVTQPHSTEGVCA